MAGNYRRKNTAPRRGHLLGHLLLVFVFFIAGYLSASVYDLTRLSGWIGEHAFAKTTSQILLRTSAEQAPLPKPKFEFYTLLAKERVAGAAPAAAPPATVVAAVEQPVAVLPAKTQALPLHAPLAPVASAGPIPAAVAKIPAMVANNKDAYLIQVGSFKSLQEAERMKATLAMKGFDVKLSTTTQQRLTWYRVTVGPFASRAQAQQILLAFARRERIVGMIRKMDA